MMIQLIQLWSFNRIAWLWWGRKLHMKLRDTWVLEPFSWLRPGLFSTLEFALVHWLTAQRTFFEPSWSHWLENWILLPAGDSFILLENFNDSETGGSWRGWTEYEPEWSFVIGLLRSPQTVHNYKIHGHMSSTLECRKGPKSQSLSPSGIKLAPSGGKFYTWPWAS